MAELVGMTIGDAYQVTALLGEGAMGSVYEAKDLRLGRKVALKIAQGPEFAQQLRNEAQALAAIRHPGLLTVHALQTYGDLEIMVMERVYGQSLDARLQEDAARKHQMSLEEVIDLSAQIADALSAAHRAGVSHRDLKPGNVMLWGERVVLVDFGLVVPENTVGSADEGVAGSAEYMAPEVITRTVARGNGPLVDLYALGIMIYELLIGHTPFVAPTFGEVFEGHRKKTAPDAREERADTPAELALLVRELLMKDPSDRPPSAEAVLWRLREIRRHLRADGQGDMRSFHVFIVDDDRDVLKILARTLHDTLPRVRVTTEVDPQAALEQIARVHPHIVLMDVKMPKMNGVELAMALAALPLSARPTIVAMSAQVEPSDLTVLRSLGVRHFIPKDQGFAGAVSAIVGDIRSPRRTPSSGPASQR